MKFKSFIWISASALVILALVQFYFIRETFRTKQLQFDSRHIGLGKLGLYEFENRFFDKEMDSVFFMLDDYSYFAMPDLGFAVREEKKDSLEHEIAGEFLAELNQARSREYFLREYYIASGADSVFLAYCDLKELNLLSYGEKIPIPLHTSPAIEGIRKNGYLLNSYTIERNYFRLKYDYYLVFPERTKHVFREMVLTIGLSFVTLIIVFGVFFLTLRNLLIQKRLSDLKTDFINNMTHELKTPLSVISVASSSLAMNNGELPKPRILEISELIKKQNKHLTRLIDRILDITIWEKGQVRIEKKPVMIHQFLSDVVRDFKTAHPESNLLVDMDGIAEDQQFPVDEIHMKTVINNLLTNALKYGGSPPGIQLKASCNKELLMEIIDNGPGIPAEEKDQIFEKFFRGKEAREHAIRGLGLGLYYVKQIVEAHSGSIRLGESNEKGSNFIIQIPE